MTPELAAKRQHWFNGLKPGELVIYNEWAAGYSNKPALVLSVHNISCNIGVNRRPAVHKQFIILVDEITRSVYQELLSPICGWKNTGLYRSF